MRIITVEDVFLTYPYAEQVEGLILKLDIEITALNEVVLTLTGITLPGKSAEWTTEVAVPGTSRVCISC